jgi:DNA-binding response OmpR family regulator
VLKSVVVLLVEDEIAITPILQEALEEGGYSVETASDAAQAIAMIETEGAAYKALITDVNLRSKVTGWDLARRARELTPDVPVVYMTGGSEHEWTANGVPYSILLTKPFVPAQLLTAVSQLLNVGGVSPG